MEQPEQYKIYKQKEESNDCVPTNIRNTLLSLKSTLATFLKAPFSVILYKSIRVL